MLIYDKTTEQHLASLQEIDKMKLVKFRILKSGISYWETEYRINGKRRRKKLPFYKKSQKAEAREFAKGLYMAELRGDLLDECKTTFKEMAQIYLRDKTLSDSSKQYRLEIIYHFIGDARLDKISYVDYERIKKYLKKERKIKNQSINRYLADVGAILNLAKQSMIIKDFPTPIKLDAEERRETRALTKEEIQKIYSVLPDYLKDPFTFAYLTGWRKANLVNFQRKHLTKRPDGTFKVNFSAEEMKRRKPFEHICTQAETEIINRNLSLEHKHIFRRPKVNGSQTNHLGDFKKAIITAREKSGIHFTWHWLRHTCSTEYAKSGVQEQTMNTLMAWSPTSKMAGNYSHLREADFLADLREGLAKRGHVVDTSGAIEQSS